MKLQETLKNWGGVTLNAVTDEDIKDISLVIKYNDHGDEFLYIRTYSGEQYTYGYWLNRKDYLRYDQFNPETNDGRSDEFFIKRPILFRLPDKDCIYKNAAYFAVNNKYMGIGTDGLSLRLKCKNKEDAKRRLCYALKALISEKEVADKDNIYYDFSGIADSIIDFAIYNDLDESEWKEIRKQKWDSSVNGFDGVAGKKIASNYIYADAVEEVLYRGKGFDVEKLRIYVNNEDEWGCETIVLNTKQLV